MAQRTTIEDYGLSRVKFNPTAAIKMSKNYPFMRAVGIDPATMTEDEWETYDTWGQEGPYGKLAFEYSISVPHGTLVVREAELADRNNPKERYTEMRAWEVIIDSWLTGQSGQAATTVDGLKYLVFESVDEKDSKTYLNSERSQQASSGKVDMTAVTNGEPVVVSREGSNWAKITWLSCCQRVATNLSAMSGKQIGIVRALAVFPSPPNLIVELGIIASPAEDAV